MLRVTSQMRSAEMFWMFSEAIASVWGVGWGLSGSVVSRRSWCCTVQNARRAPSPNHPIARRATWMNEMPTPQRSGGKPGAAAWLRGWRADDSR